MTLAQIQYEKVYLSHMLKKFGVVFATFFAIFGGAWLLLEPLGGFQIIVGYANESTTNQTFTYYISLISLSISVSIIMSLLNELNTAKAVRPKEPSEIIEVGGSRANFNQLEFLRSANERVELLGLSLPSFANEAAVAVLRNLVYKGVHIHIIIVNPLSPTLGQRPTKLYAVHPNVRVISAFTFATLHRFQQSLGTEHRELIQTRIINVFPGIGSVRVDDKLIWSPYLAIATGATAPYFLQSTSSIIGKLVVSNFEELWNNHSFKLTDNLSVDGLTEIVKQDQYVSSEIDPQVVEQLARLLT